MNSAENLDLSEASSGSHGRELSSASSKSAESRTDLTANKKEKSDSINASSRILEGEKCTISEEENRKITITFSNQETIVMVSNKATSELTIPVDCAAASTIRRNLQSTITAFTSRLHVNAEITIELTSTTPANAIAATQTTIKEFTTNLIKLNKEITFKNLAGDNSAILKLTLTTYPEFKQVDSSTVYSVEYDFGVKTLGRMMCKKSGGEAKEVIVSNIDSSGISYVDYNGLPICTAYPTRNDCDGKVYPLDLECDEIKEVKDMTFKEVTITISDETGKGTWSGYKNIVPAAVISSSSSSLPALCYHTGANENGFLYKHTAQLSTTDNNVNIAITKGTNTNAVVTENDVCIILSTVDGKSITIDNNKDLSNQCDICKQFTVLEGQLLMSNYKSDECTVAGLIMTIGGTRTRLMINNYKPETGLLIPTKCENSADMMKMIRKGAKVSISVNEKLITTQPVSIVSYENNIMELKDGIDFSTIPARMLDTDASKQSKMIITLTPSPDFIQVDSSTVYSVKYNFGVKTLGRMMCKKSGGEAKEVIVSKTDDSSGISYVDYGDLKICTTAYRNDCDGKVYPLDLECDEIKEVKDMTFKEVEITISVGTGKGTWSGYDNILPDDVKKSVSKSAHCYKTDSSKDFGKLSESTPITVAGSSNNVDFTITITDAVDEDKYICYLTMTVGGTTVDLSTCENKDKFYKNGSDYYMKDIYLNRVETDDGKTTTGSMKIQSIIDTYFNTSQYTLYIPTNDEGNKFKDLVVLNNIIEITLGDFSETVQITDVDGKHATGENGYYLLKITPPIISIKSKYEAITNKDATVLTNKLSSNVSCSEVNKKYICKHMFLSLNLGIEGGKVTVTKKCLSDTKTIIGNVLAYKSPISYIEYDEDISKNNDGCYSDYKVSTKRTDLSLYHTSVVQEVGESSDKSYQIEWTGYADALKLMGFGDSGKINFKCLKDGKLVDKTEVEYKYDSDDVIFTFDKDDKGKKCYTFIKGDKTYVNVKDSEASFLFNDDGGKKEEIADNEIKVDSKPVKDEDTSKVELEVGKIIVESIQAIYTDGYKPEGKEVEEDTQNKLPVPLPTTNKEVLTNKIIVNEVFVTVRIIYDDNTIDIREALITGSKTTSDNKYMILTTNPQIDLSKIDKERRMRQLQQKTISSISMSFSSLLKAPTNSLSIEGLDLKPEGGKLHCKTEKGEGIVDVTYYNKGEMIILPTSFIEENDKPQCSVLFKRNDYSLYADSIVTENKITWKGYAEGFNKALSSAIPSTIPFVCYNPSTKPYELKDYNASYTAANDVIFTFNSKSAPSEGSICFPTISASNVTASLSIDKLDIKGSCSNSGSKWYFGTIDGNPINKTDEKGNPTISFTPEKANEILSHFKENKEILLPKVSNDNITSLFLLKCEVGMILEYNLNGILKDSSTISSVKRDSENIYIKTIKPFDLPEPRTRMRSLTPYVGGIVSFAIRESVKNKYLVECSGSGTCDRTTGKCNCFDGFTGHACQRLDCPNNCNGNGRCVALSELLSNEDLDGYVGYGNADRIYGCLCDKRHRGYDCSLIECPSGVDPEGSTNDKALGKDEYRDCSGRGICNYNTGVCECFDGFSGEGCQTMAQMM